MRIVWILGCFMGVCLLYYSVIFSRRRDSFEKIETLDEVTDSISTFLPHGWTGVPLSTDNTLYIDPSSRDAEKNTKKLKKLIRTATDELLGDYEKWMEILGEYVPRIGINGIVESFSSYKSGTTVGDKLPSSTRHHLGDLAVKYAKKLSHATQINSRNIYDYASLHGAVKQIIAHEENKTAENLLQLANNDLCYFRKDSTKAWISCIHGLGHGFSAIHGIEYQKSLKVCELSNDPDFKYICASGVYMSLLEGETKSFPDDSFAPCDVGRFPASCFRNKKLLAKYLDTVEDACFLLDNYHSDGCAYGLSFAAYNKTFEDCSEYCSRFEHDEGKYILCVDGFLTSHKLHKQDEEIKKRICNSLTFPQARDICFQKHYHDIDLLPEEQFFKRWETDILERNFIPNAISHPVELHFRHNH